MIDTLLGVAGIAYSYHSDRKSAKEAEKLRVELSDTKRAVEQIQRLLVQHLEIKSTYPELLLEILNDYSAIEQISKAVLNVLAEQAAFTGQSPLIIVQDPRLIDYIIVDVEDKHFESHLWAPYFVLSPELIRLPTLAPEGYKAVFQSGRENRIAQLGNPIPAFFRFPLTVQANNYWQFKLMELGSTSELTDPEFHIDTDYWKSRLNSLKKGAF